MVGCVGLTTQGFFKDLQNLRVTKRDLGWMEGVWELQCCSFSIGVSCFISGHHFYGTDQ